MSSLTFSFLLRKETDVSICHFHKVAFLFLDLRYFLFIFFLSFENLFNGKSCAVTENRETQPLGVRVFKYVKTESIKHNLLSKMVQVLLHPQWMSRLELCRDTLFLSFVKMNVKAFATSNSPSKHLLESFSFTVTVAAPQFLHKLTSIPHF